MKGVFRSKEYPNFFYVSRALINALSGLPLLARYLLADTPAMPSLLIQHWPEHSFPIKWIVGVFAKNHKSRMWILRLDLLVIVQNLPPSATTS